MTGGEGAQKISNKNQNYDRRGRGIFFEMANGLCKYRKKKLVFSRMGSKKMFLDHSVMN